MTFEIRPFDGEWVEVTELLSLAFGQSVTDAEWETEQLIHEPARSIVAVDGKEIVGHTSAFSLPMTVPGRQSAVAGVSMVGVRPTHRRRGLLRDLMKRQLTEQYESGAEPLAVLTASEPEIYGRFGYGLATDHLSVTIPQRQAGLRPVAGTDEVSLRYADVAGSIDECGRIHNEVAATRPGMFVHDGRWRSYVSDESMAGGSGNGATSLRCVQSLRADQLTGYAYFRTKPFWENGRASSQVLVSRVHATDLASYVALWKFLLDQDLMVETTFGRLPSDDPLLSLLMNPRTAMPRVFDGLWARLVDVPRALAARTYESEIDVVLGVRDEACPWNAGSWRLVGGPAGASCERTAHEPDLLADVREYGAVYFGRPSLAGLAAAGLVEERTPGALAEASRAFRTERLPWLDTVF